ncbi:MAG: hypothetical protein LBE46_02840 [Wolbachia pipientis]|nr:hypothetical protein [Wolbachia pipientis]
MVSFQRVTLESSLYYAATYLKLSFLDPSSQGTGMTGEGTTLKTFIPLRVSGI